MKTPIMDAMIASDLGGHGSKGISDHPDVHEIDRKLSTYRDHDLEWSKCPAITADEFAEVVLKAVTDERPHFRYPTSEVKIIKCFYNDSFLYVIYEWQKKKNIHCFE